jgi:hypothetical protein
VFAEHLGREKPMSKYWLSLIGALAVFAVTSNQQIWAQASATTESAPASVKASAAGSATVVTVHGKVVAVDKAKKIVTIEEAGGAKVNLKVDNPYNLDAAKVGDPVEARYYEVVSVRKKNADENLPSVSVSSGIMTAKAGQTPGATAEQKLSVIFSVAAVDKANGTVTIKGPDGSTETVKAKDPRNLEQLNAGDELVVSSTKGIAVSLDKETAAK